MGGATHEIEIKLPFASAQLARGRIIEAGAREVAARHFEDNSVWDSSDRRLEQSGRVLRIRRRGSVTVLTLKTPVEGDHRHKVRLEDETCVERGDVLERILGSLELAPRYRYQKFRTIYELDGLQLCLDETPLGCFVELEGAPEAIDRLAQSWGFEPDQYVIETYRDLHERRARERGEPRGDSLIDDDGGATS